MFPSKWLSATDLPDGDTVLTIQSVTMEKLKNQQTQRDEEKPCIAFVEDWTKPMICNTTNWKQIEKATGAEDSDEWVGKKIILFAAEVEAFGEMKLAIRVRGNAPVARKPLPAGRNAPSRPAPRQSASTPHSAEEAAAAGADGDPNNPPF